MKSFSGFLSSKFKVLIKHNNHQKVFKRKQTKMMWICFYFCLILLKEVISNVFMLKQEYFLTTNKHVSLNIYKNDIHDMNLKSDEILIIFEFQIQLENALKSLNNHEVFGLSNLLNFPIMINSLVQDNKIFYSFSNKPETQIEFIPFHATTSLNRSVFVLFFGIKISFSLNQLKFIHFKFKNNSVIENLIQPEIEIVELVILNIDDSSDEYFQIKIEKNEQFLTGLRNLIVIDNNEFTTDLEFLYLGIANLRQSIYFYMETGSRKLLRNRSEFNIPPALTGNPRDSFGRMYSLFSKVTKQNEWCLMSNHYEFLTWEISSINTPRAISFSILMNLDISMNAKTLAYFTSISEKRVSLLTLYDKSGHAVITLELLFGTLNNNSLPYRLSLKDKINLEYCQFKDNLERSQTSLSFSFSSLQLVWFKSISNQTYIQLIVRDTDGIMLSSPIHKYTSDSKFEDFSYLIFGSNDQNFEDSIAKVIVNIFDLQVFEGGFLVHSKSDPNRFVSVSKFSEHIAICKRNRYVNRPSGDPEFDMIYQNQVNSSNDCTDWVFNKNCNQINCEFCGIRSCLQCKYLYKYNWQLGFCENILFVSQLSTDYFSKVYPSNYSHLNKASSSIFGSTDLNFSPNSNFVYGYAMFDIDYDINPDNLIVFEFNGQKIYLSNALNYHYSQINKFFNGSYTSRRFFAYTSTDSIKINKIKGKSKYSIVALKNVCSDSSKDDMLKFMHCENFSTKFLMKDIKNNIIPSKFSYEASTDIFPQKVTLKCKNNCQCQDSPLSCDSDIPCADNEVLFQYLQTPRIQECVSCHNSCKRGCNGPLLSECIVDLVPDSVIPSDCLPDCQNCENKKCKRCDKFSNNLIFEFNSSLNSYQNSEEIFCGECPEECETCLNSTTCSCLKEPQSFFQNIDASFNICIKNVCFKHCIECDANLQCTRCSKYFKLVNGICTENANFKYCALVSDEDCLECAPKYVLFDGICLKCPSNCLVCAQNFFSLDCLECEPNYSLSANSKCFLINQIIQNKNTDLNKPEIEPIIDNQDLERVLNCLKIKLNKPTECIQCLTGFYLLNGECLSCPSNSKDCINTIKTGKIKVIECLPGHYIHPTLNICIACESNCSSCKFDTCFLCLNNLFVSGKNCVECNINNCASCTTSLHCKLCIHGYYLDSNKLCKKCKHNCKECKSKDICTKCIVDFYLKNEDLDQTVCKENSIPVIDSPDEDLISFFTCSQCQYCQLPYEKGISKCSQCKICQKDCRFSFFEKEENVFELNSPDIIFSKVEIQFKNLAKPVFIQKQTNKIIFKLNEDNPTQILYFLLVKNSLKTKNCLIQQNINLNFKIIQKNILQNRKKTNKIKKSINYVLGICNYLMFFQSFTNNSSNSNMFILFFNLNSLFNFSFIQGSGSLGISKKVNYLLKKERFNYASCFPLSQLECIYSSHKILELCINFVPLFSTKFLICSLYIILFVLFSIYYFSQEELKIKEFFYLFIKQRMDKEYMKKFFKVYQLKLSSHKMNQIIKYLKKSKKRLKANIFVKTWNKILKFVFKNNHKIGFIIFEITSIQIAQTSAKSIKILLMFPRNVYLFGISFLSHFCLATLMYISLTRFFILRENIKYYLRRNKIEKIKEYLLFTKNIIFQFYLTFLVYLLIFASHKLSSIMLILCISSLMLIFLMIEDSIQISFDRSYLIKWSIFTFVILGFCSNYISKLIELPLSTDIFFFGLNLSHLGLFIYEKCFVKESKLIQSLKKMYKL